LFPTKVYSNVVLSASHLLLKADSFFYVLDFLTLSPRQSVTLLLGLSIRDSLSQKSFTDTSFKAEE